VGKPRTTHLPQRRTRRTPTPEESIRPRGKHSPQRKAFAPEESIPIGAHSPQRKASAYPRGKCLPRRKTLTPGENARPGGRRPPRRKAPTPEEDARPRGKRLPQRGTLAPEGNACPRGERLPQRGTLAPGESETRRGSFCGQTAITNRDWARAAVARRSEMQTATNSKSSNAPPSSAARVQQIPNRQTRPLICGACSGYANPAATTVSRKPLGTFNWGLLKLQCERPLARCMVSECSPHRTESWQLAEQGG